MLNFEREHFGKAMHKYNIGDYRLSHLIYIYIYSHLFDGLFSIFGLLLFFLLTYHVLEVRELEEKVVIFQVSSIRFMYKLPLNTTSGVCQWMHLPTAVRH